MSVLNIVAKISVLPEYKDVVLKELTALCDASRSEVGNIKYEMHQHLEKQNEIVLIETWESQDAIDKHNKTAHFKNAVQFFNGKIESIEINTIKKIY